MYSILIKNNKDYNFIENEIYEFKNGDDILYTMFQGHSEIDYNYVFYLKDYDNTLYKFSHESGSSFKNYRVLEFLVDLTVLGLGPPIQKDIDNITSDFDSKVREFKIDSIL